MIEKVLNRKNLYKAYRQVARNKGSAGVDGMKVTELFSYLENNRDRIATSILNHTYVPKPIKGVEIPKSNGKTRLLGVPTAVERWLQQAVSQVLMTKYELTFEEHSYGFRPEKNIHKAVTQALKYINDGYQDIVDIDLKGFFDEVDHTILLQFIYQRVKCPTSLRLIRKWLRAPIQINGKLHRRNLNYVRYADDFSIYTKSKNEARKVGNEIYLFLRDKLRLPINREKSGIRRPSNFELLGHAFVPTYQKGSKGKYQLVVKKNSWKSLKRKLKQITKKTKPYSFEERLKKLAEVWRGWVNNYRLASIHAKLKAIDEWLRNRLRYCIWHDWKKPERKRKNLMRRGVDQDHAYAWSRTRKGGWAVAQSPILITTITLSRLRRKGYESMLSYYLKSQPTIQ